MEKRTLGRTRLAVSALGFGCGAVGGLMVKGAPADQERAVKRAVELGINYFDTAPLYGNGESERNLGRVLKALEPDVLVGTKVRIQATERGRIAEVATASLEASLERLGRDHVDLFQLHSRIAREAQGDALDVATVLEEVAPAFERLRRAGKTRFLGITAIGETDALQRVVDARAFDTAQVPYNMLNPSAGTDLPPGYPGQDYGALFERTRAAGMGVIGIRVLAGGALSGLEERHPLGMPAVEPIASGHDYRTDAARARRLAVLVAEGHAGSLVDAALRFAISHDALGTVLVGYSTLDQLEEAAAAVEKGPLPPAALDRLRTLQEGFVGEKR